MSLFERFTRHSPFPVHEGQHQGPKRMMPDAPAAPRIVTVREPTAIRPPVLSRTADDMPAPDARLIARSQPQLDPEHVTRLVGSGDANPRITRSGGNEDGYTHLSSLIGVCEREQTISRQHGIPIHETVSGGMKIIWAIGRAVEKHIRESVIKARDYRDVHGKWVCRCGHSEHVGLYPTERTCGTCWGHLKYYREPLLIDHDAAVVGSPDLTLIEMGFYLPVEVKSMAKDQFDELKNPLADHVLQVLGYRHLYKLMGYPVMDIASIVYGRKDFKFGGTRAVYKEYHVHWEQWQPQIDAMFEAGRRIKEANLDHRLLPRPCASPTCTRAKGCKRANMCFTLT